MSSSTPPFQIAALYRFGRLQSPGVLQASLRALCERHAMKGTLILAPEGINGTVAGSAEAIATLVARLETEPALAGLQLKYSQATRMPFHRLKVKLKDEIVTMGQPGIDPLRDAGTYVEAKDWNALVDDPDTIVIDTRNDYEVALGSFAGAIDPGTRSFRDFPQWVATHRSRLEGRRIAMFCTGGIRCEKATAYLRSQGFEDVRHLKGGILGYLKDVPVAESRWQGECFVFDERVAVLHGLAEGDAQLCRACRRPLTAHERASPLFVEGVSCPHCHGERRDQDRARYAERHRQVELANARGDRHIGQRPSRRR